MAENSRAVPSRVPRWAGGLVRFSITHPTADLAQPMLASVPCSVEVSEGGGLTKAGDNTEASGAG